MNSRTAPTLEGRWQMTRAELAGELAPELVTAKTVLELSAGEYRVSYAGELSDRGTYAVLPATEPRRAELRGLAGPNAGRTIPCVFQLAGDRLRIGYGLDGAAPDDFRSDAAGTRYVVTYRRIEAPVVANREA